MENGDPLELDDSDFSFMSNEEMPSYTFYKTAFDKFENRILGVTEYNHIKGAYLDSFGTYPVMTFLPKIHYSLSIFRARIIPEGESDQHWSNFSYNPNRDDITVGRANLKGYPVFYAANSEDAALRECKDQITEGQTVYISQWKLKDKIECCVANFIYDTSQIALGDHPQLFNSIRENALRESLNVYDIDKQESAVYHLKRLSGSFLREDHQISSFLGHYYLYDNGFTYPYKPDIIMYPSIQSNFMSFNVAIRPDFVDNYMELVQVQKVRVNKFETEGGSHVTLLATGRPEKHKTIIWYQAALIPEMQISDVRINSFEDMPLDPIIDTTTVNYKGQVMIFKEFLQSFLKLSEGDLTAKCWEQYDARHVDATYEIEMEVEFQEGILVFNQTKQFSASKMIATIRFWFLDLTKPVLNNLYV